jgi:hypothetical protein
VHYTVIDDREAPPRPSLRRGGKRHQELDVLITAWTPGKVARIDVSEESRPGGLRNQLYEAAARLGRPVAVWDQEGVLYVGLSQGQAEGAPGAWPGAPRSVVGAAISTRHCGRSRRNRSTRRCPHLGMTPSHEAPIDQIRRFHQMRRHSTEMNQRWP